MNYSFLEIIDWLYSINATFGVDHVTISSKVYWLDTTEGREDLENLYKNRNGGVSEQQEEILVSIKYTPTEGSSRDQIIYNIESAIDREVDVELEQESLIESDWSVIIL